jgi:hypothetical protein
MFRAKALHLEVCCGGQENYMIFYDHVIKHNINKTCKSHYRIYINTIIQKTTTYTSNISIYQHYVVILFKVAPVWMFLFWVRYIILICI